MKNDSAGLRTGHAGLPPSVTKASNTAQGNESSPQVHIHAVLFNTIQRWWWIVIPLGLGLSILCAFAAWLSFVPKYSASAYLRIDSDNRPLIFKTADESVGRDFKLYKNTHQQLMVTPFVLSAALRETEVSSLAEISNQDDAIGWLQANLKVSFPGDGEIMQVSVQTLSPDSCVKIVNGVVNAFLQEVVQNERKDRLQRLDNLEKVYGEAETKVRNKRGELKSISAAAGTSDSQTLSVAQQSILTQFGRMAEKLGEVQFLLMQAEGELKMAEDFERRRKEAMIAKQNEAVSTTESAKDIGISSEADERTVGVVQVEEEIALANSKLKILMRNFGFSHPSVVSLTCEIELKNQLLELRKQEGKKRSKLSSDRVTPEGKSEVKPEGISYDLVGLFTRTQVLGNQEKILQEKVDKLSEETKKLGKSSIDVELMRAEISTQENVLNRVWDEIERTKIELKTTGRIKLLSPAVTSTAPDMMKRLTRAMALGVFGLVAPYGLFAIWDLVRKRVINGAVTSRSLSLPTIGTIPRVAMNPLQLGDRDSEGGRNRTRAELEEALDGLASMILHNSQTQNLKVFMISSAMPGEGKSTVACQLAQALARAGKLVALVDFDLRRPSLHRYLKLPLQPGVSESLNGELSIEDSLQTTETPNLRVMTAGDWCGNLHERCTSGKVDELFDSLRDSFDLVIVDSSPVLYTHDCRVIGKYTDGVILTLVRDRSRLPEAAQACEIMRSYGVPVLGTIIIGVNSPSYPGYFSLDQKDSDPKPMVGAN